MSKFIHPPENSLHKVREWCSPIRVPSQGLDAGMQQSKPSSHPHVCIAFDFVCRNSGHKVGKPTTLHAFCMEEMEEMVVEHWLALAFLWVAKL
jgi:hypothetical protein